MSRPNPFTVPEVAERYAQGRPYHHRRTVERCLALLPGISVGSALDVGCGTGLSTRALAELGFRVAGVDITPAMVAVAHQQEGFPIPVSLPVSSDSWSVAGLRRRSAWAEEGGK